jgi:lactate dehydrogenase-like 2-hydroxyacid dehydrogenase
MRLDGQTDMTTIIAAFRNFAKAHKNVISGKTPSKTTEMETFWHFSKYKHSWQK